MSNYYAVLAAAGCGSRMASEIPKQYLNIQQRFVIEYSLECLLNVNFLQKVMVILSPDDTHWINVDAALRTKVSTALGGETRAHSVLSGLLALNDMAKADDWVLVHDAARPCLQTNTVQHLIEQVADHPVGGILGIPVTDTLKSVEAVESVIQKTVSRQHLWQAQTPQLFRYGVLLNALQQALEKEITITDEAQSIEAIGRQALMVTGDRSNIKITYPEDLALAAWYLSSS